jgi:hypothetical protein
MAPILLAKSLPGNAQLTAAKMTLLAFRERTWHYNPNYPLADAQFQVQVRDGSEVAPPKEVARYAEMMKPYLTKRDQLTMPPVVVTADGYVVDGNTRIAAARKLEWLTFPAFVLNDRYEGAPTSLIDRLIMLGTMLNMTHGRGLSRERQEQLILQVSKDGDSPEEISRKLQISRNIVLSTLKARDATERLMELGVDMRVPHITKTHLAALGSKSASFNNEVYRNLAVLIRDTAMSTPEQGAFMKKVLGLGSDQDKLAAIEAESTSRNAGPVTGRGKPPRSAQLRQHLGFVLKYAGDPGELVESTGDRTACLDQSAMIRDTLAVLYDILAAQERLNGDRAKEWEAANS